MKTNKELVYCTNCEYFKRIIHQCSYSKNVKKVSSYLRESVSYIKHPKKINKNNNCSWYKKLKEAQPPKSE